MKRRDFIFIAAVGGAGYLIGANIVKKQTINENDAMRYIKATLSEMFETSGNFPNLNRLNTMEYFSKVQHDPRIEMSNKTFILDGARWISERADEMFDRDFLLLSSEEKEKVMRDIAEYKWGDNWLYKLYTFYFESMFCDPLYGSNINKSGWKYLSYEPGFPRPSKVSI